MSKEGQGILPLQGTKGNSIENFSFCIEYPLCVLALYNKISIMIYSLTTIKVITMFDFHSKQLSDILKELAQISNQKINQRKGLEQVALESNMNQTLSEIFKENGLEHIGDNKYSNKTHGETTKETLVISINKRIIDMKNELKLEVKVSTVIGEFEKEFSIFIKNDKNQYWIEKTAEEDKIFTIDTMKDELKEELEKGFNQ